MFAGTDMARWVISAPMRRSPKKKAAGGMSAGCRPAKRATTIPEKPYPEVMPSIARRWTPVSSTAPASPAKAPESSMAAMRLRWTRMPAYLAAFGSAPDARRR